MFSGIAAIATAALQLPRGGEIGRLTKGMAVLFTASVDIQILTGLVLWIYQSRWMGYDPIRSWEHPATMVAAAVVMHIGYKKSRSLDGRLKYKMIVTRFGLSLGIILFGLSRVLSGFTA